MIEIYNCLRDSKTIYETQIELNLHSEPIIIVRDEINRIKKNIILELYKSLGTITKSNLLLKVTSDILNIDTVLSDMIIASLYDTYTTYKNSFKTI